MAQRERMREEVVGLPTAAQLHQREAEGWQLVALEWQREAGGTSRGRLAVPYGLRVAADCKTLEEDPQEIAALTLMLGWIDDDLPLSQVAEALNERGYSTRSGQLWTQVEVFYLLPRIVESAPALRRKAA